MKHPIPLPKPATKADPMNHTPQAPPDPRTLHRYSQIIRRVERGELPHKVAAYYHAGDNILYVDREIYDEAEPSVRNQILACTDILYLR